MPQYAGKSVEELRFEDYQRGNKGAEYSELLPHSSLKIFLQLDNKMLGSLDWDRLVPPKKLDLG